MEQNMTEVAGNQANCSLDKEDGRLAALYALQVMDTPPEKEFDDLVWLASRLCDTPIALVSLVDANRQWFKASLGLEAQETPRSVSFCAHALDHEGVFVVPDAAADPRFSDNPLVTGEPYIRFYAGAPLSSPEGYRYGTLCIIDTRPRNLDALQSEALQRLARRAVESLEIRRLKLTAETRQRTLQRLLETMPGGVVTCNADGVLVEFNRTAREWHGIDPRAIPQDQWAEHFGLYEPSGEALLKTDQIPLLRAWRGERVRETEMIIRTAHQPARLVACNADPLFGPDGELIGAVCTMHDITRLDAAQRAAASEAQRFNDAFAAAAQGMALVTYDGHWQDVNDALCKTFGYPRAELMRTRFEHLVHPDELQVHQEAVRQLVQGLKSQVQFSGRYLHRSGAILFGHLSISSVSAAGSRQPHMVVQLQDLTEQHRAAQRLRESEQQLRAIANNVPAWVGHVDRTLRFEFINEPYARHLAISHEEISGTLFSSVFPSAVTERLMSYAERARTGETVSFDMELPLEEGGSLHMHVTLVPDRPSRSVSDGQERCGFYLTMYDITEQTQRTRGFEKLAMTDALTGLPNRAAWNIEFARGLHRARQSRAAVAVMFLDLNDFKAVNDTYGHDAGDTVLCEFARRLTATLRNSDFIARLAGDEFVVLLDHITDPCIQPRLVAEKLLQAMGEPVSLGERTLMLRPSIGLAIQQHDPFDAGSLLSAADRAMYRAKQSGAIELIAL